MTNGQKFTLMLKAGGLWAKTSAKGGRYLTGRLGGVKVLILANRDRQSDDEPSHHLFFVEAPDRRQGGQGRGEGSGGAQMPPTRQTSPQPHRSGFQGPASGDDDVPPWER
jgi:hypothetical protein